MAELLDAVANLSHYHREHEKFYAEAPLRDALELQRITRTLHALAERWEVAEPDAAAPVPYAGAPDLNDPRAIETLGVLFMEHGGVPPEITQIRAFLSDCADRNARAGAFLAQAMETSWKSAEALLGYPELADLLGERHHIIANDWINAATATLVARHLERAEAILARVDFDPDGLRADLAGPRAAPRYLHAAAELIDRAADLFAESSIRVHRNERRWRVFSARVAEISASS